MPIFGNGLSTVLRTIKHHAIRRSSRTIPRRSLIILGLESSADDSCAAVVTDSREIKANVVIRQDDEHRQYGGIHPYVAIKTHQSNMPLAIRSALLESGCGMDDIDGIAFTRGPGMPGCLSVAAGAAKALAAALGKPLVGVHHMHAHAVTPFLTQPANELPEYPFLTFLLTGGHTLLLLAKDPQTFQVLADTVDSSIGAAYDHASRVLSLPSHPKGAGAALEAFCAHSTPDSEPGNIVEPFITPMRNKMAFSFSGVLSQLAIPLQRHGHEPDGLTKLAFARAFQEAAARHLTDRLLMALSTCRQDGITIKHLVVSGGVASNMFIRQRLQECLETASTEQSPPIKLICPPRELCTDNAAMIAWASMSRFQAQDYDDFSISLRPTWKIADLTRPDTVDKQWHGRRSRAPKDPLLELEHIE